METNRTAADTPASGPETEPPETTAPEISRARRYGPLLGAWIGTWVVFSYMQGGPVPLMLVILFPIGLVALAGLEEGVAWLGFVLLWALYLGLTIGMLRTKKPDTYMILLVVLCVLLFFNVRGCNEYLETFP